MCWVATYQDGLTAHGGRRRLIRGPGHGRLIGRSLCQQPGVGVGRTMLLSQVAIVKVGAVNVCHRIIAEKHLEDCVIFTFF